MAIIKRLLILLGLLVGTTGCLSVTAEATSEGLKWSFGADWSAVGDAIEERTGVHFKER